MRRTAVRRAAVTAVLVLSVVLPVEAGAGGVAPVRQLDGFLVNRFRPCDDSSPLETRYEDLCTADRTVPQPIGFPVNFFGADYSTLFVNNNGNVTFREPLYDFTPLNLTSTQRLIIAPFFADVDTRNLDSNVVTYGNDVVDGRPAFGVNWLGVGYYSQHAAPLNSFQLVLIERSDVSPGDFDIEFNYDTIGWEAGDGDGGLGGLAQADGQSARIGYARGVRVAFELPGSGIRGAFLDSNAATGLAWHSLGSTQPGRYVFRIRSGAVLECTADAQCDDDNPCTVETCLRRSDQAVGECRWTAAAAGTTCDDGDSCTEKDACDAGVCRGRQRDCGDGDDCTEDVCDPTAGCIHPIAADETVCDDADGCTDASRCVDGTCTESPGARVCRISSPDTTPLPTPRAKIFKFTCEASRGSTCEAQLFELTAETGSAVPQAILPGTGVGRPLSALKRKTIRKRGRVTVKLQLNAFGRKLLKASGQQGLHVLGRVTIVEPSGTRRAVESVLTLLRLRR